LKSTISKKKNNVKKEEKLSGVNYTELNKIFLKSLIENNEKIINAYKDTIKEAVENSIEGNSKKIAKNFEKAFTKAIMAKQEKQNKEMRILLDFAFKQAMAKSGIGINQKIQVSSAELLKLTNRASITNKELIQKIIDAVPGYYADKILNELGEEPGDGSTIKGKKLIKRLKACKPETDWREYEKICKEIISFCFVPPLFEPIEQVWNDNGDERKDLMIRIPPETKNYWGWIFTKYDENVIVECKDYTKPLKANVIHITDKYFGKNKASTFGIILCRNGVTESAHNAMKNLWTNYGERMICLIDQDLIKMITMKEKGEDPGTFSKTKIFGLIPLTLLIYSKTA